MSSKYHVHHDHERTVVTLTIIAAGFGLLLVILGWFELPKTIGGIELAGGVILLPMAYGLWNAREWARIGVGCLSCAACVGLAWYTWKEDPEFLARRSVAPIVWRFGPVVSQAVFLLLPSTRRTFAVARAAKERERSARGQMRGSRLAYRKGARTPEASARGSRTERREPDA